MTITFRKLVAAHKALRITIALLPSWQRMKMQRKLRQLAWVDGRIKEFQKVVYAGHQ